MKRNLLLTLLIFSLLGIGWSAGTTIPVSAAAQSGMAQHEVLPVQGDMTLSIPRLFSGLSNPLVSHLAKGNSYLTIFQPQDTALGDYFSLSGYLRNLSGGPVASGHIQFTLNGNIIGQASTNSTGYFSRKFPTKNLASGTYTIGASYNGSHLLTRASASTHLIISLANITVQTVPAIPGLTFQLDGKQYVTGPAGTLTIGVNEPGVYHLSILMDQYSDPTQRIEFSRWLNGSVQPSLDIAVPSKNTAVQVGFNVYHRISLKFVDLAKFPVDAQRVTQVTYRSAQGDVFDVKSDQPQWIPASRVARLATGLVPTPLLYSVITVMADGSNVVNSSQQQFYALADDTWQISMLLYSISFSASDGLFNFPVGTSINLMAPDGTVKNYPLDLAGTTEIHSLARGNYSVQLVGAFGLGSRTPVALSRNQSVAVKEISFLDLAVLGVVGIVLTLGLLLYGRPQIFTSLLRRNQPQVMAIENASIGPDGNRSIQIAPKGVSPSDEFFKQF
jgi:hypothetical protein